MSHRRSGSKTNHRDPSADPGFWKKSYCDSQQSYFVGSPVSAICLFTPLENFLYGIFDIKEIVLYLSTIILVLFLTVQALEKRRWS